MKVSVNTPAIEENVPVSAKGDVLLFFEPCQRIRPQALVTAGLTPT